MSIKSFFVKLGFKIFLKKLGGDKKMWQAIRELFRVSIAGGIAAGSAYATDNPDNLVLFLAIIPPLLRAGSKWLHKKYPKRFDWLPI